MLFLWGHIFRDTVVRCALCVVSQQLFVEIDRDGELVDADVLVFSVHGCVLLVVDVDGREADHGVERSVKRLASVPAGRMNGATAA